MRENGRERNGEQASDLGNEIKLVYASHFTKLGENITIENVDYK